MSTFNFVAASRTQIKNKKRKHPCHRGFLYKREGEKKKRGKKNFCLPSHGAQ